MLPALRFLLFSAFVVAALARNGPAMRRSLELVTSPAFFSPSVPCIACGLGAVVVAVGYCIWLAGATFERWRMPNWTHLVPAAGLLATTWFGPLRMVPDGGSGGPADRAMRAVESLTRDLSGLPDPCAADLKQVERRLEDAGPPTGFRSFGRPVPFHLVAVPDAQDPVREIRAGDGVGTVYLACPKGGRSFWVSVVLSDRLPRAEPTLLRDGVGKVAVFVGESKP